MGCGKSTIGRYLAEELKMGFLDTDVWIEEKEGITISEIFAVKGEKYFRDLETECLKELMESKNDFSKVFHNFNGVENYKNNEISDDKKYVISVGGGLPMRQENQKLLKQLGLVVYLKVKPNTVYNRIKDDTTRPLLQTADPLLKIKEMMAEREDKYQASAHKVVESDEKNVFEIVKEIITFM